VKTNRRTILKISVGATIGALLPAFAYPQPTLSETSASTASDINNNSKEKKTVKVQDVFALIITDKMTECRDFYTKHFGFETTFETTIYLQMSIPSEDGRGFSLAFMPTNHPFGVVGSRPFSGYGMMLTIQVADTAALYKKVKAENAEIIHPLTDEDWGQRRFTLRDPAGVPVCVVQSIEPKKGYYDKYQVKK